MPTPNRPTPPPPTAGGKRTLAGVVGVIAATMLLSLVPGEESGRKVDVSIAADGSATVRHVSGPQYLRVYLDLAGVPTACDGLTRNIRMGQTFTEAQCAVMLEAALVEHAEGVMRCTSGLRRDGRDYQRAAAVSLAYNIGVGGYCGSTARRQFDAGNLRAACDAFLRWNKGRVRGVLQPVRGLTLRRQRERALCLTGVSS